jgi:hypothetical protein
MADSKPQPEQPQPTVTPQAGEELQRSLEAVEAATARTADAAEQAAAAVQEAAAVVREQVGLPDAALAVADTGATPPGARSAAFFTDGGDGGGAPAVQALQSVDFNALIGGPLLAGINATAQAAMATAQYIQTVGFTGTTSPFQVNTIQFSYSTVPAGQNTAVTNSVTVPLLSLLPIPYLRVDSMDIEFKAQINSMKSVTNTNTFGVTSKVDGSTGGFLRLFQSVQFSVSVANTNVNTSVAQQTSNYSLDVRVHAGVDPIPAGMQRVLNIFESVVLPRPVA